MKNTKTIKYKASIEDYADLKCTTELNSLSDPTYSCYIVYTYIDQCSSVWPGIWRPILMIRFWYNITKTSLFKYTENFTTMKIFR